MARQYFLAGGVRGTVGKTVTQKQKYGFIARRWVQTPNPNTPKQAAKRHLFKTAIQLAQAAMEANGGISLFRNSRLTEFTTRVKQAKQALDLGKSEDEALPLFPSNYNPGLRTGFTDVQCRAFGEITLMFAPFASAIARVITFGVTYEESPDSGDTTREATVTLAPNATEVTITGVPSDWYGIALTVWGVNADYEGRGNATVEFMPIDRIAQQGTIAPTWYRGTDWYSAGNGIVVDITALGATYPGTAGVNVSVYLIDGTGGVVATITDSGRTITPSRGLVTASPFTAEQLAAAKYVVMRIYLTAWPTAAPVFQFVVFDTRPVELRRRTTI